MLPQRLARSKSAWAPLVERRVCARQFHASIPKFHEVPSLHYKEEFEKNGVAGLFSEHAYDVAWNQNMTLLIERLNKATKGTDHEMSTPKQIVLSLARNPTFASVFSAASMAHNNHFFFDSLSPIPYPLESYPTLEQELTKSFGSIDILRRTMLTTANAMTGPGFVWLVQSQGRTQNNKSNIRILTTYNAGTPYPEAMYRQQGTDQNTTTTYTGSAGAFGASSARAQNKVSKPPGTELVTPLLCVSTWEHAYLHDFGVAGKQNYLVEWWKSINWGAVDNRLTKNLSQSFEN